MSKDEIDWYCGPIGDGFRWVPGPYRGAAAAARVLLGPTPSLSPLQYKIDKNTQSYLANKMGTNKIGFTSPIAMARELTKYINKKTHRTGTKYKAYRNIKNSNLWAGVRGSYFYNTGPIVITVSAKKSWYPKAGKNVAHYVVIYGFDDTTNYTQSTYLIWDPAYGKRKLKLKATDWQKVAYYGQLVVSGPNTPF